VYLGSRTGSASAIEADRPTSDYYNCWLFIIKLSAVRDSWVGPVNRSAQIRSRGWPISTPRKINNRSLFPLSLLPSVSHASIEARSMLGSTWRISKLVYRLVRQFRWDFQSPLCCCNITYYTVTLDAWLCRLLWFNNNIQASDSYFYGTFTVTVNRDNHRVTL